MDLVSARIARFPPSVGLRPLHQLRRPHHPFGACSTFTHVTACVLAVAFSATFFTEGFARSTCPHSPPVASGWSDSCRVGYPPPTGVTRPFHGARETSAISTARTNGEIKLSEQARHHWREIYPDLTKDLPGRWGKVTSRSEAQVLRSALIYCLLDGQECIEALHLQAAEALWSYCSESARWAFMEFRFSRHAQLILDAISEGPLTLTQLSDKVFKRNLTHAQIHEAMREIAEFIGIEKQKTAGRDAVLVSLKRQL